MAALLPIELVYFREAALAGSVNAAAARLRVAGSAVSRQIRKLERALGVTLFVRHGRGVELTEEGRRLLTHVRRSETETATLLADLAGGAPEAEVLDVACSSAFSTTLMARVAVRLRTRHPAVRLRSVTVSNEEATRLVAEERVDLAATFSTRPAEGVRIEHAVYLPTYAIVAAGHSLAGRGELGIAEALDHPCALLRGQSSQRELLVQAARNAGRELEPVLECDQHEALIEFARLGGGVAFGSTLTVPEAARCGLALAELTDPELRQRSAQLQTSPWRQLSPAQMDFLEIMSDELAVVAAGPAGAPSSEPAVP